MQTFLPYLDIKESAACLDDRRLWKQILESYMIVEILEGRNHRYGNHPAILMWRGYTDSLKIYTDACINEWAKRGKNNNSRPLFAFDSEEDRKWVLPPWYGNERAKHISDRIALLTKNYEHYNKFGWTERPDPDYVNWWPSNNGYCYFIGGPYDKTQKKVPMAESNTRKGEMVYPLFVTPPKDVQGIYKFADNATYKFGEEM